MIIYQRVVLAVLALLLTALPAHAQTTTIGVVADVADILKFPTRSAPALATMGTHAPDFVICLSDCDHRTKKTLAGWSLMWDDLTTCQTVVGCEWVDAVGATPYILVPGDHDGAGCNNADKLCPNTAAFLDAFKNRWPDDYPGAGLWSTRVVGPVRVIALDVRTQREPFGTDGPTAMLGSSQQSWLTSTLGGAAEPWIVIAFEVPLAQGAKPLDAWASKPVAQAAMDALLTLHCAGRCLVLSADMHTGGGYRLTAWGAEMTVPHLNLNGGINVWGSCVTRPNCGTWDGLTQGRHKPGFVVIRATATSLTAEVRGVNDVIRWSVTLP